MLEWYVAKVKTKSERYVTSLLNSYGVEIYAPEITTYRRGNLRQEPVFPGYAFARIDAGSAEWRRARWTKGLSYFLPSQQEPLPVTVEFIDDLRARVGHWNDSGWASALKAGDRVQIEAGSLRGLDAIFYGYLPGNKRCEILISLVGRDHRVIVESNCLKAQQLGRGTFVYAPAG